MPLDLCLAVTEGVCGHKSARGDCRLVVYGGDRFCQNHTCPQHACSSSKGSTAATCTACAEGNVHGVTGRPSPTDAGSPAQSGASIAVASEAMYAEVEESRDFRPGGGLAITDYAGARPDQNAQYASVPQPGRRSAPRGSNRPQRGQQASVYNGFGGAVDYDVLERPHVG